MDRSKNEPGTLGAEKLSTGANVSRAIDSLNATDTPVSGGAAFSKHNFDKIDPSTGDIILTPDTKPKKRGGLFGGLFSGRAQKSAQPAQPESTSIVESRSASVTVPAEYQNPTETKKPINKKFIIAALIVIAVLAIVAVVVVAIMQNQGKSNNGQVDKVIVSPEERYGEQLLDALDTSVSSLEEIFASSNNGTASFLDSYDYDELILDTYNEAFLSLDEVSDILTAISSDNAINSADRITASEIKSKIELRSPIYYDALKQLDTFHQAYVEIMLNNNYSNMNSLLENDIEGIRDIAQKMAGDSTWEEYMYGPGMIQDIFALFLSPINYESDGFLADMIQNFAIKMIDGENDAQ